MEPHRRGSRAFISQTLGGRPCAFAFGPVERGDPAPRADGGRGVLLLCPPSPPSSSADRALRLKPGLRAALAAPGCLGQEGLAQLGREVQEVHERRGLPRGGARVQRAHARAQRGCPAPLHLHRRLGRLLVGASLGQAVPADRGASAARPWEAPPQRGAGHHPSQGPGAEGQREAGRRPPS